MAQLNRNPSLFGLPYQFPDKVDPRLANTSKYFGKNYIDKIISSAPICTIIPGVPSYLPNTDGSSKENTSIALLQNNEKFNSLLRQKGGIDDKRLYDFKTAYTEYMSYVNVLCRAAATFLELEDTITVDGKNYSFKNFDWKKYRWDGSDNVSAISKISNLGKYLTSMTYSVEGDDDEDTDTLSDIMTNKHFIQFYVDSDVSCSESFGNATSESQLKGMLDSGSSVMKELAFMANSGGMDASALTDAVSEGVNDLTAGVHDILGANSGIGNALSRVINLGSDVLTGANIVIPDIYQNSSYSKSYSITIHLRSPYGSKLGYFMNICVPMLHILALVLPRQSGANSYQSPFIVKAYVDSIFSCNMGMITGLSIQKTNQFTTDGLPTEVDVNIELVDLYSQIYMSPSTSPTKFVNNSSLVEYLAVTCGLSLTAPNYTKKIKSIINSYTRAITDMPTTAKSYIDEGISGFINSVLKLY